MTKQFHHSTTLLSSANLYSSTTRKKKLEPHKYFPDIIKQKVKIANSISTRALPADSTKYPVIDIHPWIDPSNSSEELKLQVVHQVLEQATSNGSFNIVGHDISSDILDRLENSTKEFFSKEHEEKMVYSSGNNKFGYVSNQQESVAAIHKTNNIHEQKDLREIYSLVYPPEMEDNMKGPDNFQEALDTYITKLQTVELALTKIFTAALSLAKGVELSDSYLVESEGESISTGLLRASRYPSMPEDYNDANRLVAHSDWSSLTILYSRDRGLEEIRDGRWVEVPTTGQDELHVTIGEIFTMWSNGLFVNNIHRVSSQAEKDRLSFAYFLSQGQKCVECEGIEPVCSKDEVAKFPRVSTYSHINNYISAVLGKK